MKTILPEHRRHARFEVYTKREKLETALAALESLRSNFHANDVIMFDEELEKVIAAQKEVIARLDALLARVEFFT